MATRLEVNFKRLLNRCEVIAAERNDGDWRLEKVDTYMLTLKQFGCVLKISSVNIHDSVSGTAIIAHANAVVDVRHLNTSC